MIITIVNTVMELLHERSRVNLIHLYISILSSAKVYATIQYNVIVAGYELEHDK